LLSKKRITPATDYLLEDEPCYLLTELNRTIAGKRKRVRTFTVVRGDKLSEYIEVLKRSNRDEFRIIGGGRYPNGRIWIEHTVAELRAIAENMKAWDKRELAGVDRIKP